MEYMRPIPYKIVRSRKGFTLLELIITMLLFGTLIAMAMPSYLQWRKNLEYKTTARAVVAALREARSRAINDNQIHQVIVDTANKKYRLADYTTWTFLTPEVSLYTGTTGTPYVVQYNPNGTSSGGTINVRDISGTQEYQIVVNTTGRIVVSP